MSRNHHRAAALAWMDANPKAMAQLLRFALDAKRGGIRVGIALLVERVRWFGIVEQRDAEGYKINNNFRSHLARRLMLHAELLDYFETRYAEGDPLCPIDSQP